MKAIAALFILSLVMIGTSLSMTPFDLAPDGSYPMLGVPPGDSEAYALAREQALTAKFSLQDYGLTLLICSMAFALYKWRMLRAPQSLLGFVSLAIAAPLATAGALAFDLMQDQARLVFPP